jgi:hypothetical protein
MGWICEAWKVKDDQAGWAQAEVALAVIMGLAGLEKESLGTVSSEIRDQVFFRVSGFGA